MRTPRATTAPRVKPRWVFATGVLVAGVVVALAPAARADSGTGSISGYTANVQALGVQAAFNIPGLVPLPDANLLEEDLAFARTTVSNGPVVNALGAPYYPGDILGNFGSLMSEFAAGAPPVPNDPLLAEAEYPPAPGHGQDATFGGTPPAGFPIAPNVFSAQSHAAPDGSSVTSTLSDLSTGAPSSSQSKLAQLGPAPGGSVGSVLGGVAAAAGSSGAGGTVDVASIQSTNTTTIGGSTVTSAAGTVLKGIDIAGVLTISQLTGSASSTSDGTQGTPTASLHLADVSVEGQPAYIDQQGVHVTGQSTSSSGVTPQQAQSMLNSTFAQDGITVRLLDPSKSTNGAEGIANSGGLVVSISHQFAVSYIPGEPSIPVPGLGNTGLPAGVYNATTSFTLGSATTDLQASTIPAFGSDSGALGLAGGGSGVSLGISPSTDNSLGSSTDLSSQTLGATDNGTAGSGGSLPPALAAGVAHRLPLGIPLPVAWVLAGLILCVLVSYPMLLTVRWQFLSGRRR